MAWWSGLGVATFAPVTILVTKPTRISLHKKLIGTTRKDEMTACFCHWLSQIDSSNKACLHQESWQHGQAPAVVTTKF
jgi:hypothetical protein